MDSPETLYDPSYSFGAYRRLKQSASRRLGIEISIPELDSVLNGYTKFAKNMPILEGTITGQGHYGKVYYIKLSMQPDLLGDQAEVINLYAAKHPKFPQESTMAF